MTTLHEYQSAQRTFDRYSGKDSLAHLTYSALGLAGEAGEFADKVKKIHRDANGTIDDESRQSLLKELGDVLWYLSKAAGHLNATLQEVAALNIDKLTARRERGTLRGSGDDR